MHFKSKHEYRFWRTETFIQFSISIMTDQTAVFFSFTQDEIDAAVRLLLSLKLSYKTTTGQDYQAGLPPKDHALINNGTTKEEDEDLVDPWNVQTSNAKGVDYDKLIGTTLC